jgi:hypothetical protein
MIAMHIVITFHRSRLPVFQPHFLHSISLYGGLSFQPLILYGLPGTVFQMWSVILQIPFLVISRLSVLFSEYFEPLGKVFGSLCRRHFGIVLFDVPPSTIFTAFTAFILDA